MCFIKKRYFLASLILISILFSNFVYSYQVCQTMPKTIKVSSGNNYLGNFSLSPSIFINQNFQQYPLRIEFIIENDKSNCFNNTNNLEFNLFSGFSTKFANSFITINQSGKYVTSFIVIINNDLTLQNSIVSSYKITSTDSQFSEGNIIFSFDKTAPIFEEFSYQPVSEVIGPNEQITITYRVSDSESGLKKISIVGDGTRYEIFNDNTKEYSNVIRNTLQSTITYKLFAEDKLGNIANVSHKFVVDSYAPLIISLKKTYEYISTKKVSFAVVLNDTSFKYGLSPTIIGDFSSINPDYSSYKGNCIKNADNTYMCSFKGIEITKFKNSKVVPVVFTLSDALGNTKTKTYNEEIFVDNQGPTIIDFYLKNSIGEKNIFNSNDKNLTVYLKFQDKSIPYGEPRIIEEFDFIRFPNRDCKYDGEYGECKWKLGDISQFYSGIVSRNLSFRITLYDFYSNMNSKTINLILDNQPPVVDSVKIIETESIKDNVIKSKERFNVRLLISDSNLGSANKYYVYGDFSLIDFSTNKNRVEGLCSVYNLNTTQCDFNSIKAENGYIKRNITFTIYDVAGNKVILNREIEVFQISNETFSSFKIEPIKILNPLNRNQMKKSGGVAWFEGRLDNKGSKDITILNYQLKSCKESDLNPILINRYSLFPNKVVVNEGQKDVDMFAMRVELKDHPNFSDLNNKKMDCEMSVLKRDKQKVFPPEIVSFEVEFSFYDVPQRSLMKREASKILELYDDISYLGGWLDSTYSVYSIFKNICGGVGGGTSTISQLSQDWQLISKYLRTQGILANQIADAGDKSVDSSQSKLSDLFSCNNKQIKDGSGGIGCYVKMVCDFVTCRNGANFLGRLTGSYADVNDESGLNLGLQNVPGLGGLIKGFNNLCTQKGIEIYGE